MYGRIAIAACQSTFSLEIPNSSIATDPQQQLTHTNNNELLANRGRHHFPIYFTKTFPVVKQCVLLV